MTLYIHVAWACLIFIWRLFKVQEKWEHCTHTKQEHSGRYTSTLRVILYRRMIVPVTLTIQLFSLKHNKTHRGSHRTFVWKFKSEITLFQREILEWLRPWPWPLKVTFKPIEGPTILNLCIKYYDIPSTNVISIGMTLLKRKPVQALLILNLCM